MLLVPGDPRPIARLKAAQTGSVPHSATVPLAAPMSPCADVGATEPHSTVSWTRPMLQAVEPLDDDLAICMALNQLPEADRRLLVLVHVDGYSCPEVAVMTGSPPGGVRTAQYGARNNAREVLS